MEKMNNINSKEKARLISTFKFSMFYWNLPHQDLIQLLHELVEFSCNSRCKDQNKYRKYLTVMGTVCVWKKRNMNPKVKYHAAEKF